MKKLWLVGVLLLAASASAAEPLGVCVVYAGPEKDANGFVTGAPDPLLVTLASPEIWLEGLKRASKWKNYREVVLQTKPVEPGPACDVTVALLKQEWVETGGTRLVRDGAGHLGTEKTTEHKLNVEFRVGAVTKAEQVNVPFGFSSVDTKGTADRCWEQLFEFLKLNMEAVRKAAGK